MTWLELGFDLADPRAACLDNQIVIAGEVVQFGRMGDFELWDALRRKSLEWRLRMMNIHVEPSDKNYGLIVRIQNEISAETVRLYKSVDEQPFKKPVIDRSADHLRRWQALKAKAVDAEVLN